MHTPEYEGSVSRAAAKDLTDSCLALGLISGQQRNDWGLGDSETPHPNARIPESTMISLWQTLAANMQGQDIGLKIGRTINPAAKGLLASWISQTGNLREALVIFTKNIALMNPSENWTVSEDADTCRLNFALDKNKGYPDMAIERSMSAMLSWARALSNHPFPLKKACFRFPKPDYAESFIEIFGDQLEFDAPDNYLLFDSRLLGLAVVSSNELLKTLLAKEARQSLRTLSHTTPIVLKVKAGIRETLRSGKTISIVRICSQLAMSRQTLYRRLKQQGTDFQSLLEQVRKEEALTLIEQGMDAGSISISLGYKDSSSFYKAFKRWYGATPKTYLDTNKSSFAQRRDERAD